MKGDVRRRGRPRAFDSEKNHLAEQLYLQGFGPSAIMRKLQIPHATFYRLKAAWHIDVLRVGILDELHFTAPRYNQFPERNHPGLIDVQFAKQLARALNVRIHFKPTRFPRLFSGLDSGAFDLALGLVGASPDRVMHHAYSEPYIDAHDRPTGGLVARRGLALSAEQPASFSGLTVGALALSLPYQWLAAMNHGHFQIKTFGRNEDCHQALLDRRIDASLCAIPYARAAVAQHSELELKGVVSFGHVPPSVVMHRDNDVLLERVSNAITGLRREHMLDPLDACLSV